jgi:hypothetical protein
LRDVKRDQAMTQRAWNILQAGGLQAYEYALAALREDTRAYWLECLADPPGDGMACSPTAGALKAWIDRHWKEWYEDPLVELEHREVIRDQAIGAAYATDKLESPARYEVHLDRKLERTLAMLIRLAGPTTAAGTGLIRSAKGPPLRLTPRRRADGLEFDQMPIRRELRALYPPHWKELSHRVRFERAGGFCEALRTAARGAGPLPAGRGDGSIPRCGHGVG